MIGNDYKGVKRCFDLKGSLHDRITEVTSLEIETGDTGFKVLKDKNMLEQKNKLLIQDENKNMLIE